MKENSKGETAIEILYEGDRVKVGNWFSDEKNPLFVHHSFRRAVIRLMFSIKEHFYRTHYTVDFPGAISKPAFKDFIVKYKEDFIMILYMLTRTQCMSTENRIIAFFKECDFDPKQFKLTKKTEGLLPATIHNCYPNFIKFLTTFPDFISYKSCPKSLTEGEKALERAVRTSRVDHLEILIEAGLEARYVPGIYVAEQYCNRATRYLIEKAGVSPDQTVQPYNMSLLQYAMVHKNFVAVAILMGAKASLTTKDDFGFTPLHDAVWSRDVATAEVIGTPETINAQLSFRGPNYVYAAALDGCGARQERRGANDVYALDGSTPLHIACRSMHTQMVAALLQEGARVDILDSAGNLPLDYAFIQWDFETISTLISAGADFRKAPEARLRFDIERLVISP